MRLSQGEWVQLVDDAARFARLAQGEALADQASLREAAGPLVAFYRIVRGGAAESFPHAAPTARLVAGAFLNAARAFALPEAAPETRTACAPLLAEAARTLDHFLTLHRHHQAASTWGRGQFGGDA